MAEWCLYSDLQVTLWIKMEQYCEGEGTEMSQLNICSLGQFFKPWIIILKVLCLISHTMGLTQAHSFLSTLRFVPLQHFPELSCHHGYPQALLPPLPEILSLTFYLVSPTHLSKQAQTLLLSPFPQLTIVLYICHLMNADTAF